MGGLSFRYCIPQSRVSRQPLFVHTNQHGDGYIRVVVNLDFGLVLVEAMQAAHVLLERTSPRNRCDKEKCVQPSVVKSLSQVASGSENYSRFIRRNRGQRLSQLLSLPSAHPAPQNKCVRTDSP